MVACAERVTRLAAIRFFGIPFYTGALALPFEGDFSGRQTALIAADTIFQITVDIVVRFGEADLLDEGGLVLEVFQLHVEHLVHLLDDVALRSQFANPLSTVHLHYVEGGLDRAVLANIRGIDMPTPVDGGVEDNLGLCSFAGLQL